MLPVKSMEELLPIIEREGIRVECQSHPYDFDITNSTRHDQSFVDFDRDARRGGPVLGAIDRAELRAAAPRVAVEIDKGLVVARGIGDVEVIRMGLALNTDALALDDREKLLHRLHRQHQRPRRAQPALSAPRGASPYRSVPGSYKVD